MTLRRRDSEPESGSNCSSASKIVDWRGCGGPVGLRDVGEVVRDWAQRPRPAAIFDFNGTLSDDESILFTTYKQVFKEHLGWAMTEEDYLHLWGRSDREMVEVGMSMCGVVDLRLVESLLAARHREYRARVEGRRTIREGTESLVERLKRAGIPVGIVTGAKRDEVVSVLDRSGIKDHFDAIITEDDVAAGKPDPEGFLAGARLLEADPAAVLAFEDSPPGILAAVRAGMTCIAVVGPFTNSAALSRAAASVPSLGPELLDSTNL